VTGTAAGEPACEGEDGELVGCLALPQVEGGEDGEAPVEEVDFEALAYQAYASFSLGSLRISMSPSAETPVLVQVPVWMWVDADDWQPETATASVPGGSVTVTATPSSVSWDMGDGQSVDCKGPGTAYDASEHDPAAASPDCGHTYTSTNGGSVDVTASMSWAVEWETSTGEGGALPDLTTETSTTVQVVESSSLVTTTR
jgi:hypothetical protein